MLSEVREEFSVDIPMTQLFKHNTVADFSLLLDQKSGTIRNAGYGSSSFFFKSFYSSFNIALNLFIFDVS